ncbi:MAG: D-alanyl-D-alanine carboxypeptidase/D-alanyl-D-alanine-endopeptidase [Bacteroidetes bacterium]|nr:MAG: D-alanyl-D-alanine carboxypeptidase/D-alanyl-D-alanine-endopeptidase [Bacteroidota bacterium]
MFLKKIVFGLVFFVTFSSSLFSQINSIQSQINQLLKDPAFKHASVGISVMDVKTGKMVASHNADQSLIPASILKVVTTSTTAGILGSNYKFKTELQYSGDIDKQGNLKGNLYIKGYGDPTLASPLMEGTDSMEDVLGNFVYAILQKNILCVEGHIIGDASWFGSTVNAPDWPWIDLGNYYAAGVWGLNFHENLYYLHFLQNPQLKASPRIMDIEPEVEGLAFYNEVKSAKKGSGDNAYIYGAPYSYERYVRGTIPVGNQKFTIKGSLPDPPLFAAQKLKNQLAGINVPTSRGATTDRLLQIPMEKTRKTLYTHYSPDLKTIIKRTNIKSVNLYCETFLKTLGKRKTGEGTEAQKGLEVIEDFWTQRGLSFDGVSQVDGSGLSRTNLVTARFMASLLRKTHLDPKISNTIYESLPIAGKSGGLKYYLRGTVAEGKLRAKTGTLENVRSFAGYATNNQGKKLAFCIIVNNHNCSGSALRKKLAPLMQAMCR